MKDCFAYKNRGCTILKVNKCQGPECPFYKTKGQYKLDQKKVMKRILSLDKELQVHINETYYNGKMGGKPNER